MTQNPIYTLIKLMAKSNNRIIKFLIFLGLLPFIIAIVSIIVAILVLVVLPHNSTSNYQAPGITKSLPNVSKYQDIQTQTKDAKVKTDFRLLQQVLAQYKKDKGNYPKSLDQLNKDGALYIIPQSPYPNSQYNYQVSGNTYTLSTTLGDGSTYSVTPETYSP